MTSKMDLVALQLKTSTSFEKNIQKLEKAIKKTSKGAIILAPELYLTGYSYNRLNEAVTITKQSTKKLLSLSKNKTIILTMTTQKENNYYNTLFIFHKGKIIHQQSKNKLFVLNDERKYFTEGNIDDIKIVNINGIKIAALICFELRYIELWKKIQGADIILVPAMWGKLRKENFKTLTRALAVANQCFVVASDSSNINMAKSSSIISPFGNVTLNDKKKIITQKLDIKEIKKMRRYLNVGIN